MPTIQHWQGWVRQWTEETDGRPCSQRASLALTQRRAGWLQCRGIRQPGGGAAPGQASVHFSHASAHYSTRGVPDVKRALPPRACATWRLDRVRRSCHVSAGPKRMLGEPHTPGDRRQLPSVLASVQSEVARQTCRLYHDLGVECGCRRA
jgi:hypothetical protein